MFNFNELSVPVQMFIAGGLFTLALAGMGLLVFIIIKKVFIKIGKDGIVVDADGNPDGETK